MKKIIFLSFTVVLAGKLCLFFSLQILASYTQTEGSEGWFRGELYRLPNGLSIRKISEIWHEFWSYHHQNSGLLAICTRIVNALVGKSLFIFSVPQTPLVFSVEGEK